MASREMCDHDAVEDMHKAVYILEETALRWRLLTIKRLGTWIGGQNYEVRGYLIRG